MRFSRIALLSVMNLLTTGVNAACNGYDALCSKSYSNITFIGTHDSAFYQDGGILPSDNQNVDVATQLSKGIRFLQGQTHNTLLGSLNLCHTSCLLLNGGSLTSYLTTVATFLAANPNEVVTILLTNGDGIALSKYAASFEASGADQYVYHTSAVPSRSSWPTLQELIDNDTRLIVWMDYHADLTQVDYILDEFGSYFETSYDVTDSTFPDCSINRPSGVTSASSYMYIVNHFLDVSVLGILIPDRSAASTTNSASSIDAEAFECVALYGRYPNAILVDFFDDGDVFTPFEYFNGLS